MRLTVLYIFITIFYDLIEFGSIRKTLMINFFLIINRVSIYK